MLPAKNERKRAQVMNLLARKEDDESLPPAKTIGRGDAAMKLARQDRLMMSLKSPTPQTPRVITIQKPLIGLALRKTAMICTSGLNIHPVSISTNVIRDKLVALARGPGAGVLSTYGAIPVGLAKPRPVYSPRLKTKRRHVLAEYAEGKIAVLIARLAKSCAIKLRLGTVVDVIVRELTSDGKFTSCIPKESWTDRRQYIAPNGPLALVESSKPQDAVTATDPCPNFQLILEDGTSGAGMLHQVSLKDSCVFALMQETANRRGAFPMGGY
ncbi:hypothetical protein BO79DRAFT_270727 [Aspergillus costaricaensis CBS 115574]|uniref:Uncharacterized protein n=1 Tax=Aspergillus costaricaensis CBS 115574 TaxID=1448317 RepID=A0ACD1I7R2_9EURO|nr:hypothetical protein BO79DRAFT_270727 [Aspergillus costaricaensis CBS 115574]RAK86552.1 hypothetical protein BO79DRAFT_270727 [Aspergillus costaricaensis CBS 115574]